MGIIKNSRTAVFMILLLAATAVGGSAQAFSLQTMAGGFQVTEALNLFSCGPLLDLTNPPETAALLDLNAEAKGDAGSGLNARRPVPVEDWVHAVCMMAFSLGTLGYWVDFYTTGDVRTSGDQSYIDFESAFVLADTYMAAAYMTSAILLVSQQPLAVPVGIAAGSSSIYLGCMDLLYDLQHNKFSNMNASMAFETFIIAASFGLGGVTIARFWQALDRLVEGPAQ